MMQKLLPLVAFALIVHSLCHAQMIEWTRFNKSEGYSSGISSIATDKLGNVYYAGVFYGTTWVGTEELSSEGMEQDTYLAKYDTDGNLVWVRHITGRNIQAIYGIACTSNDQIVATGIFQNQLSIDGFTLKESPNYSDFGDTFLLKFDQGGSVIMARNIGFSADNRADGGGGITTDTQGNIYVVGGTGTSMFFTKTDDEGNIEWRRTHGSTNRIGSLNAGPLAVDRSGNLYAAGIAIYDPQGYLLKYNTDGEQVWVKEVNEVIYDLDIDRYDNLIVAGDRYELNADGDFSHLLNGYFGVMNIAGEFIWKSNTPNFVPHSISLSPADELIYFSGMQRGDETFGAIAMEVEGESDILLGAISLTGVYSWITKFSQQNGGNAPNVRTNTEGYIFAAGRIEQDSVGTFQCVTHTAESKNDLFLTKITPFKQVPITGPSVLCPGSSGTFSYTPISEYIDYRWTFSPYFTVEPVDDTHLKITATNSSGLYYVGVETSADLGCKTMYINHLMNVQVDTLVTKAIINGLDSICPGQQHITYSVENTIGNTPESWTIPDFVEVISKSREQLVVDFSMQFADGEIIYTRTGDCNFEASEPFAITAKPLPGEIGEIVGLQTVCAGSSGHQYSIDPVAHATQYNWTINRDGAAFTDVTAQPSIEISVHELNEFIKLSVTASNACGVSAQAELTLDIARIPHAPSIVDATTETCPGEPIFVHIAEVTRAESYHWTVKNEGDAPLLDEFNEELELEFRLTDHLTVSVSSKNFCGESDNVSTIIRRIIDPIVSTEINFNCKFLSHNSGYELRWLFDGVQISTDKNFQATTAGTYTLQFVGQCSTTETSMLIEESDLTDFIPNVITPNGDQINDQFEVSSALRDCSFSVFDRSGSPVFHANDYNNEWGAEDLPYGVYYYVLRSPCSGKIYKGPLTVFK